MIEEIFFTVFTPTYNRGRFLNKVFESLKKQSYLNFEWLIIDDGSTDDTETIVNGFQTKKFPIIYHKKDNGGKHTAYNQALKQANGKLMITLDSDDTIVPHALEFFYKKWGALNNSEKYVGIACKCLDENNKPIGPTFNAVPHDSNVLDNYYIHKNRSEMISANQLKVIKQYPFPEYNDVKLVPEGIIWNLIGQKYYTRYFNEPLRIYVQNNDSYTKQKPKAYSLARWYAHRDLLSNYMVKYFGYDPLDFIKSAIQYNRSWLYNTQKAYFTHNLLSNIFIIATFLPSLFLRLIDFIKYGE